MSIQQIPLAQLHAGQANVRDAKALGDLSGLKASIVAVGLLQPLLVRQDAEGYAVLAGQRRLAALAEVFTGEVEIPCVVTDPVDDGAGKELSLHENFHRQALDPIDEAVAFRALVDTGDTEASVATRFGVSERYVKQRLALSELDAKVQAAVKDGWLPLSTAAAMTGLSKKAQRTLIKEHGPDKEGVVGWQLRSGKDLRHFLFSESIHADVAIFDLELYKKPIVGDLFSEERYFSDSEAFWLLQRKAAWEKADAYKADGWAFALVVDPDSDFQAWQYDRNVAKEHGAGVIIRLSYNGAVEIAEGVRKRQSTNDRQGAMDTAEGEKVKKPQPELSKGIIAHLNAARLLSAQAGVMASHRHALIYACAMMLSRGNDRFKTNAATIVREIRDASSASVRIQAQVERVMELFGLTVYDGLVPAEHVLSHPHVSFEGAFQVLEGMDQEDLEFTFRTLVALTIDDPFKRDEVHDDQPGDVLIRAMETDPGKDYALTPELVDEIRSKKALCAMIKEVRGSGVQDTLKLKELRYALCKSMKDSPDWRPGYLETVWRGYLDTAAETAADGDNPIGSEGE